MGATETTIAAACCIIGCDGWTHDDGPAWVEDDSDESVECRQFTCEYGHTFYVRLD